MGDTGKCPMCQTKGVKLTEHHIVEAPKKYYSASGKPPSIDLCSDCHTKHEKYRNYLRDISHIEIDRRKED